jgi:regulator of replication initiation timing
MINVLRTKIHIQNELVKESINRNEKLVNENNELKKQNEQLRKRLFDIRMG